MSGERTLAPTHKRQQDAIRKGDVLRSRELGTAVVILVGAAWLRFAGPWVFDHMMSATRAAMTWDRADLDSFAPGRLMIALLIDSLIPIATLALAVMFASVLSQLGPGQGRWVMSNLTPKPGKLNPAKGLKRIFGLNGWIEVIKGIAKLALLGGIAWWWIKSNFDHLLSLGAGASIGIQLAAAWQALTGLIFVLGGGLVVIALIDFPIQWMRRFMRLRMSHQEVQDEHKEAEGSPEKKAKQRQRQREIAMGSIANSMRQAQFVLTNPTHFSVALAYDPDKAPAPIVVAKGRGEKALAMRQLAAEMQVPTLEYPALARSVYFTTRENQVIREELYAAVAGVLAFIFSLKRGEKVSAPPIEVPVALRFDTEGRPDKSARA